MLVSVGIPTYNRIDGLKRALDSVLSQSYKNLEIIISNDNSPNPDLNRLICAYADKDPRIRYIHHTVSLRTVANFSFVKDQAKGKYFLFVADDDWLEPDYVEKCVSFLEANPDYTIAAGKCYYHKDYHTILHSNTNFSLEQTDFWARLFTYFRTVTLNGYYYGLMRTSLAQQFHLPNQLGFDWNIVAYMCFKGKLKTLDTTGNHISQGGMSNEGAALSGYFDQKGYLSTHFLGFTTAFNCAKNIIISKLYSIPLVKQALLALLVFVAGYSHIASWDILFLKRRTLKYFNLGANGVLFKKSKQ